MNGLKDKEIEIPDWAVDKHTSRGKAMGRSFKHFYEIGSNLENQPKWLTDSYFEKAKNLNVFNQ